ncbi:hypothetical protein BDV96DRAFT_136833 [Lophiotrema nucula]|uniref:Lysine-specific metallo-endopeptidase domain-containing protein n=1 Tax=Lophiotrema nucula TaxID=690887 RepID=A0A6A5ZRE4_9PLEO|nr:hypothetical protein BDV96DRAFT_136833 [Lophiotrema nucula]
MVYITRHKYRWDAVFDNYFNPDDLANVEQVFQYVSDARDDDPDGDADGSEYFSGIQVINFPAGKGEECEDNPNLLAWLEPIEADPPNRAVMRICDKAFKYPDVESNDSGCAALGDNVSGKMSTLGGIVLHEMMHFDPIGKLATGIHIEDYKNPDTQKDEGYGPINTRNLKAGVPQANADNYRWFAQEVWWSAVCDKSFGPPTDNGDYVECTGGESSCVVM